MATSTPASTRKPATAHSGLASWQTAHVSVRTVRVITATGEPAMTSSSLTASFSSHHRMQQQQREPQAAPCGYEGSQPAPGDPQMTWSWR